MKITYEDKVSVRTSTKPEVNKITDSNLNEIKNVVNANSNSLTAFTDNFNVPDGTNVQTLTLENAANKTATFTTTSFANVGDSCVFSSIGAGKVLIAAAAGVVFNLSDEDGISTAQFNKKGAMRLEDVGGNVVIELF